MDLFSDSEGSESQGGSPAVNIVEAQGHGEGGDFSINKEFAARFQHNKQRAELHQLEEKYGKGGAEGEEDDSSSEDETEDEEGEQVTADVDAAILTTLAKIRRKDESIYEAGKRVFDEERTMASKSKLLPRTLTSADKNKKKVTLGEYQRSRIQELIKTSDDPARALADATMIQRRDDGAYHDEEDSNDIPHSREQEELRREVTNAFHSSTGDGEEDFFTKKGDGFGEEEDPESYRKFLLDVLGGKDKESAVREILRAQTEEAAAGDAPKPARGKAPKVRVEDHTEEENEEFLMNYVLNRGWIENPSGAPKATKSRKVTEEGSDEDRGGEEEEEGFSNVDSEDSFDSRAEAFENAHNFRFEELEGGEAEAQIQSYARNPVGSVRRTEDKRKKEREERAKRKEEEKEEKKKEIDRMRDLKRKTIVNRLKKLKEATGSSNVDFEAFQLDDEFDPKEHDRLMQRAFDEEYYGDEEDGKKPSWADDIDVGDLVEGEGKGKTKAKGKKAEIEMDADFIDEGGPEEDKKLSKAEKKKMKKREKAKAKKLEVKGVANGLVDAEEMNAEREEEAGDDVENMNEAEKQERMAKAMDEYYGLDYEDMIGDQPTRFKYTQVSKSTFGLTPEEILMADDEELKNVISLKRLQPYRDGKKKPSDLNSRVKEFRKKFYQDQQKQKEDDEKVEKSKTKRMGKKERQRRKEASEKAAANAEAGPSSAADGTEPERAQKKAKTS